MLTNHELVSRSGTTGRVKLVDLVFTAALLCLITPEAHVGCAGQVRATEVPVALRGIAFTGIAGAGGELSDAFGSIGLAGIAGAGGELPDGPVLIYPDDPGLSYTEYVSAEIDAEHARFTRPTVNWFGNLHSPGARVNFSSDATTIFFAADYLEETGSDDLSCFSLEVDGVLLEEEFGSGYDFGLNYYRIFDQHDPVPREFSLIFPYGADVDFRGLGLFGGTGSLLSPPPGRPPFLYVAYGNSITHGWVSTGIGKTYPYLVGRLNGWSVINMGFSGQIVTSADGTAVGLLGADLVTAAIGTNDFWIGPSEQNFKTRYSEFLDNIRSLQPGVPVFAITPTWVDYEDWHLHGRRVEDYRRYIREVVFSRQASDDNLYLLEGRDMVPPGLDYFPDGLHPNDAGFSHYAANLAALNLVRNPGFELGGFAWVDLGSATVVNYGVHSGARACRIGTGVGGCGQLLRGITPNEEYEISAWTRVDVPTDPPRFGVSFFDAAWAETAAFLIEATWTEYTHRSLVFTAPAEFTYAAVVAYTEDDTTLFFLDDFALTWAE